jgi:oligopeptide transport system substrate-binding protein
MAVLALVCGSAQARDEAITIVAPDLPQEFDPQRAVRNVDLALTAQMFQGLLERDAQGRLVAGAAEKWALGVDGVTYTFTLRRDLEWSDGSTVEAQDFVAGLTHALLPSTNAPFAPDLLAIQGAEELLGGGATGLAGVSAPDGHTVKIVLKARSQSFLSMLALPVAMPMPHRRSGAPAERDNLLSNGPFAAEPGENGLSLVRNPHFVDAKQVEITRVNFVTAVSADDAIAKVRKGEANLSWGFPMMLPEARGTRSLKAEAGRDLLFVAVNARRPLLARRETRHALAMTIDRDVLLRLPGIEGGQSAFAILPPRVNGFAPLRRAAYAAMSTPMRTAVAEVLLAEAGVDPRHEAALQLHYPAGVTPTAIAKSLAASWQKLGVEIALKEDEPVEYGRALRSGDFDLALSTWPERSGDAYEFLRPLTRGGGPWNTEGYSEPEFNKRMAAVDGETDTGTRTLMISNAENVLIEDQIVLPIVFFTPLRPVNLDGWQGNAWSVHPLRYLSR